MIDGSPTTDHLSALRRALDDLALHAERLDFWGEVLAHQLDAGGRLLATADEASAAEAQHLAGELGSRALVVAPEAVRPQARAGDVLVALSVPGGRAVVEAVRAAREAGLITWALTGAAPNELAAECDDAVCVETGGRATVEEAHLVCVHLLCAAVARPREERAPATVTPLARPAG